ALEIVPDDLADLGHVALADAGQRSNEIEHRRIRQSVVNELALAPGLDQSRAPHLLQVLRGVRDRKPSTACQRLDAALALRQGLEKLQAMLMRDRLRHRSELTEQQSLWAFA